MLRAINLFKSLRLGCRSESADGSRSTVVEIDEFEFLGCTLPSGSESRAPPLAFSLRGQKLPTLSAPIELSRSTEDRLVCAEDVSVGNTLRAESDRGPLGGSVFLLCECNLACFPNGPRPREAKISTLAFVAAIPMIKPTTANKNTSTATCNPDRSKTYGCEAESTAPSADDLTSSVGLWDPNPAIRAFDVLGATRSGVVCT